MQQLTATTLRPAERDLQHEVRAWLDERLPPGSYDLGLGMAGGFDPAFSADLGAQGWLGMSLPREYGGPGRTAVERQIVVEELLARGAPVGYHWVADRQSGPSIAAIGTEEQKAEFLPRIAAGQCFFGIGMSEPDAGSDLAAVRTRADRVDGGWQLTGTKVWTSGAHLAHAFIALARTAPLDPQHRHAGLSQFIVNLRGPGVEILPIVSMNGAHHFNEVILDGAFVPDEMVFGTIGQGWQQVTSELAFERSGPERFLSTFVLLDVCAEHTAAQRFPRNEDLGRLVARIAGLHQMSSAVAGALQRHEPADVPAAVVKVLGTTTEGDIAEFAHLALDSAVDGEFSTMFSTMATAAVDQRPGFTLRGGTNEVLRGVIARGLGIR